MQSISGLIVFVKKVTLLQLWVKVCGCFELSPQRGCLWVFSFVGLTPLQEMRVGERESL